METSVVKEILTDRSEVFNVVIVDGSQTIVIAAVDEKAANEIQQCLADNAVHADIR